MNKAIKYIWIVETENIHSDGKSGGKGQSFFSTEDRLSLLYGLLKKHNCLTITELIAVRDGLASSLADTSGLEEKIAGIEKEIILAETAKSYNNQGGWAKSSTTIEVIEPNK